MSLLKLLKIVNILKKRQVPHLLIKVENNDKFEIEEILDLRRCQNMLEYLIQWCKYNISKFT